MIRRVPLRRTGGPQRRTALRRGKPLRSRAWRDRDPVPASVRTEVRERSGGVCERCNQRPARQMHHRLMRSQGGRHVASNLADLCAWDHSDIHANPADAYRDGWLIRSGVAAA